MSERPPIARCRIRVRGYELDSFGHLNHATYLNHLEHARFEMLEECGLPIAEIRGRGEAFYVVRVEIDYRAELGMGDEVEIGTWPHQLRNSSLTLRQVVGDPADASKVYAEALVTVVWIGPDGRPTRIPDDARERLG